MGFQNITTTKTLTAKLTPLGRQLLVKNTNNLITKFALGDSDANYNVADELLTGQVPAIGGDLGLNSTASNSSGNEVGIKYPLYINGLGGNLKSVDPASINVTSVVQNLGQNADISGNSISFNVINRNDGDTDPLVNLFSSFGLPLNELEKATYSAKTFNNGGWSDTAISGFANDTILVVGINNSEYGETLDGKEIKLELVTSAMPYTIYSTFQNKGFGLSSEDSSYRDSSKQTENLGLSVAFLVSDNIMTPNGGDPSLSWATGFGTNKPYSVNRKSLYNLTTNSNVGLSADSVVGIAYLNKGLLVITDPAIVSGFSDTYSGVTGTTTTINSVATNVTQNITCVAGRGEFGASSNPSWRTGDVVRISEVGLYDDFNRLIAYGKFDRQVLKTNESYAAFGINISV